MYDSKIEYFKCEGYGHSTRSIFPSTIRLVENFSNTDTNAFWKVQISTYTSASETLCNVIVETNSIIKLIDFSTRASIETLNNYVYKEKLRPNTHIVSLAHLLLKYHEKTQ